MNRSSFSKLFVRIALAAAACAVLGGAIVVCRPRPTQVIVAPHSVQLADGSESNGGKGGKGGLQYSNQA